MNALKIVQFVNEQEMKQKHLAENIYNILWRD